VAASPAKRHLDNLAMRTFTGDSNAADELGINIDDVPLTQDLFPEAC
jgi:hypothetical protein